MKKSFVLLIHIFYWIPSCFQVYVYLNIIDNINNSYPLYSVVSIFTDAVSFYLFYFLLFPLVSKGKFLAFIFYGLVSICLISILGVFGSNTMIDMYGLKDLEPIRTWTMTTGIFVKALYSGITACFIKGCITWYAERHYKKALEKKNLETELALLKAQLNPHFLFNTLNNIDILIEKDPEKASVYLKKLSDMIRFMLYETPSETIPLKLEIKYIEQYIELQRIRTLTPDFIKFHINGETTDLQIAPMLFIPFIENAFKHTTNKKKSNAIDIEISANESIISFHCSNIAEQSFILYQEQSGLGLSLIRSRLELLYRGKYELNINQGLDRFSVTLVLNLN